MSETRAAYHVGADLRCPSCGREACPVQVVDGHTAIVDELGGFQILVARVRCGACGTWLYFRSRQVAEVQKPA